MDRREKMNSKSLFRQLFFWIPGVIIIILLFGIGFFVQQFVNVEARGVPTLTIPLDPAIIGLQNQLQDKTISDDYRYVLETKVSILIHDAALEAEGRANIPAYESTKKIPPTETENPNQQRLTGIIDYPSVPFPAAQVIIENAWQDKINNEYVTVFAGATGDDHNEGVLIIMTEHPLAFKFIYIPGAGSVKISDFKGTQLVLQSKNKEVSYFDVPGQSFIKVLGEIVLTVTPIPPDKLQPGLLTTPTAGHSYP
jgi:hypothetical protein